MFSKSLTNALRGIAIILVIICHFIGGGYGIRVFTPFGGIGVAIFLFLSGYGLNESFTTNGLKFFWWKKFSRIVIPYFIWCGILAITVWLLPYESEAFRRYWYLEYLFLWYVLFWLTKKIVPNYAQIIMVIATICLFPFLKNIQTEQSLSFVIGVMASQYKERLTGIKKSVWIATAIALLFVGLSFLYIKQIPVVRSYGEESILIKLVQLGIKLPIGLGIIILVSQVYRKNILWRFWEIIGVVSLELYLVQMPFYEYIQGSWKNLLVITALVALLTMVLHYSSVGILAMIKRIEVSLNSKKIIKSE